MTSSGRGKRMKASLVCDTGEAREVHHFAALIGYGASAVNPYLIWESLRELFERGDSVRKKTRITPSPNTRRLPTRAC